MFLCWFEGFLEVWGWVKILSKFENFRDCGPQRNFWFWPPFQDFHFSPVSQLQVSKWHSKIFLCWFEGFLEVWGWVKILSKIENFHDCVLREISDFDQLFITLISFLWVNCKSQNGILESFYVNLKDFWKFEVESKFFKNWKFSWPRFLAKFQILTSFSRLSFQTCESIASVKMAFKSVVMLIWRISGSLRLSQNFVKIWKLSWPRSSAKIQILTTFSGLSF